MMSRWMHPRSCKKAKASNICFEIQRICGSDRPWSSSRGEEREREREEEKGREGERREEERGRRREERGREGEEKRKGKRGAGEQQRGSTSAKALVNPYKLVQDAFWNTYKYVVSQLYSHKARATHYEQQYAKYKRALHLAAVCYTQENQSYTRSSKPETSLQLPLCVGC